LPPDRLATAAHVPAAADAANGANVAPVPLAGVAVEIAARAQAGTNRFEIRLDPPELGRIDVRLDVDRQGQVTSRLVVEKAETLDMLRREAPQLERALEQAGFKTGDGGLQFSLRDQSGNAQRNDRDGPMPNANRVVVPDEDMPQVQAARGYGRWFGANGGVDIRV
jgi:flagellar hook-length control protein FliK